MLSWPSALFLSFFFSFLLFSFLFFRNRIININIKSVFQNRFFCGADGVIYNRAREGKGRTRLNRQVEFEFEFVGCMCGAYGVAWLVTRMGEKRMFVRGAKMRWVSSELGGRWCGRVRRGTARKMGGVA
jgi:hypothetical protein